MSAVVKSTSPKLLLVLLLVSFLTTTKAGSSSPARAASGMPDSPEFGYGARLDIWGPEVELAMNAAAAVGVEWIGMDFDWARHWPDAGAPVDLDRLDQAMSQAKGRKLSVLLSVTHPPEWAMGPAGPDGNQTAALLVMLANRYVGTLLTIELFPGANTMSGWGAVPNPSEYARLLQACQAALRANDSPVLLVAGGLSPLPGQPAPGDVDDLAFLSDLYRAGAAADMPILGLRLNRVEGEAIAAPDGSAPHALRHYEAIRQVMLAFEHDNGLIWVTGFTWPDESGTDTPEEQIRWLNQAYQLMKSQLYIGTAFIDQLNPPESGSTAQSLITTGQAADPALHPALAAIGQIIALSQTGHADYQLYLYKKLTSGGEKRSMKRLAS